MAACEMERKGGGWEGNVPVRNLPPKTQHPPEAPSLYPFKSQLFPGAGNRVSDIQAFGGHSEPQQEGWLLDAGRPFGNGAVKKYNKE